MGDAVRPPGVYLILALLLSVPLAAAGTEDSPEVSSPRNKANPNGDILAAWVDGHPEGLLITFKIAGLDRGVAAVIYVLDLNIGGARYSPTIGFDQNGALRTDSGANSRSWPNVDDALLLMTVERSAPAYVSAVVPWRLYPGLESGAKITVTRAHTALCCQDGRWIAPYDDAAATGDGLGLAPRSEYIVRPFATKTPAERGFFPILVPAWVIPTIVLGMTATGIGAGLGLERAMRARGAPPAAPIDLPVRAPLPPPGERFQRAPNGRR